MKRGHAREGEAPPAPEPLPSRVLDSHCHLDLADGPVDEQLAAARAVGVERVMTIGVDVPSSRWCAEVAAAHPHVQAGVALHPNAAPTAADGDLDVVAELARLPHVRAVGETGLDFYRTEPEGRPRQEESFRAHIAIAKETGKALVIHDRDAHDDVVRVLRSEGAPELVVFHCFSGGPELARVCVDEGWVMSFAGTLTFKNAQDLRDAAALAPLELLQVETDAPFLTPAPHRGRPNGAYLVPLTVRALAEVKQVAVDELCAALWATGERVFGPDDA